ncbi:hypothetical protein EGW08_013363, partial [Elysia chlorotica]
FWAPNLLRSFLHVLQPNALNTLFLSLLFLYIILTCCLLFVKYSCSVDKETQLYKCCLNLDLENKPSVDEYRYCGLRSDFQVLLSFSKLYPVLIEAGTCLIRRLEIIPL